MTYIGVRFRIYAEFGFYWAFDGPFGLSCAKLSSVSDFALGTEQSPMDFTKDSPRNSETEPGRFAKYPETNLLGPHIFRRFII